MTLSQIMALALRQLDEDPEDIGEYADLFRIYANEGVHIAVTQYVRPRDMREYKADEDGVIHLDGDIRRVIELRELKTGSRIKREIPFEASPLSGAVRIAYPGMRVGALCDIEPSEMASDADEPNRLPREAHAAIADYICYRHLSNGNMAKQSKAQFFQSQFYQTMNRLRPQGFGSVRNFKNLYSATDIRNVR